MPRAFCLDIKVAILLDNSRAEVNSFVEPRTDEILKYLARNDPEELKSFEVSYEQSRSQPDPFFRYGMSIKEEYDLWNKAVRPYSINLKFSTGKSSSCFRS